jgi:hypothetical protein
LSDKVIGGDSALDVRLLNLKAFNLLPSFMCKIYALHYSLES